MLHPIIIESTIVDAIAREHKQNQASREQRMLARIAKRTGTPVADLQRAVGNPNFGAAEFIDQFQPELTRWFKGRLGHKRKLGVQAHIPLTVETIERALSDRDASVGFFSSSEQCHVSCMIRLRGTIVWRSRYLPTKALRSAADQVTQAIGVPASEGFRYPDGILLVWLLDSRADSQALAEAASQRLSALVQNAPDLTIKLIGTPNAAAFIPCRSDMVDGVRLRPMEYSTQIRKYNPDQLFGITPGTPFRSKAKTPGLQTIQLWPKYALICNSLITYFSSRRRNAVLRLFNMIWSLSETSRQGNGKKQKWIRKKFGPDVFPISSSLMKRIDDDYSSVLKVLRDLRILQPVGQYSAGQACFDPHPRYYHLDVDAEVQPHPAQTALSRASQTLSDQEVASICNVNVRTVRNWKHRPETMTRLKADALMSRIPNAP